VESLFHIKCHKILDFQKTKKPVEIALCTRIAEAIVVFGNHKESKILSLVISGEKDSFKDNAIIQ